MPGFFARLFGRPSKALLLSKPVPKQYRGLKVAAVAHDRRLTAAIFDTTKRGKATTFKFALWKCWQDAKSKKWIISTNFYADELDPMLRLMTDCRRQLVQPSPL